MFAAEAARVLLLRSSDHDWRFVAVFAATALEQLTKAALAERNVLLLAETTDQSVLAMAGATPNKRPRTIGAGKALTRFAAFDRRFNQLVPNVQRLLELRNGVVHLEASAPDDFDRTFDYFLRAVDLLLEDLGMSEEVFWGEDLAPAVASRASELARTIEETVNQKIAIALARLKARYKHLSDDEQAAAMEAAQRSPSQWFGDISFQDECPACHAFGIVAADVEVDWQVEDFQWAGYTLVRAFAFTCAVCSLELEGDELEWGLPDMRKPDINPYEFSEPPSAWVPGMDDADLHPLPPPR